MQRTSLILVLLAGLAACKSHDKPADQTPPPAPPTPALPADMSASATVAPTPPPGVDAKGFDRTCTAATDCVVVKPAACDPCGCPTDAIASKEMAKFDEVAGKLSCPPPDLKIHCKACEPRVAACDKGTCVAVPKT